MIEEQEINLSKNFYFECTLLLTYENMYTSTLDAIFNDYTYFRDTIKTPVFIEKTLNLYRDFVDALKRYLDSKFYSRDQVFVYLDPAWYKLIETKLVPFLIQAEEDLEKCQIDYVSFRGRLDFQIRPDNTDILKRANLLYKLLEGK